MAALAPLHLSHDIIPKTAIRGQQVIRNGLCSTYRGINTRFNSEYQLKHLDESIT